LLSSTLTVAPAAVLPWTNDVFGNAVAIASFHTLTDRLRERKRPSSFLGRTDAYQGMSVNVQVTPRWQATG